MFSVGVIGLGMGKGHAKGVQRIADKIEGFAKPELYALCDIDAEKLRAVGEELQVSRLYTDYRDMIADPELDAVIIASPDQDHRRMAEEALAKGKHVLCEKPLALTREDLKAIVEAARRSGFFALFTDGIPPLSPEASLFPEVPAAGSAP